MDLNKGFIYSYNGEVLQKASVGDDRVNQSEVVGDLDKSMQYAAHGSSG